MAYYNTYSGLGSPLTNVTQAFKDKAKQIAQAINAESNPNPATATTTGAQAAQTATNASSYIIGSKTFEYLPELIQKKAAGPVAVPTTTPTVAPSNQPAQPKTFMDYMPWIIGGVGVLCLGYLILKK